jgi:hypothetical protein
MRAQLLKEKKYVQRIQSDEDCLHPVGAWTLSNRLENIKKYKAKGESFRLQFTRAYFGKRFSLVPGSVLSNYSPTSIKWISQFTYLPCSHSFFLRAHRVSRRKKKNNIRDIECQFEGICEVQVQIYFINRTKKV